MKRLNYNQLYYFYVVATEGSVKAASEKLHLTQPTISGQLRTLEDDLGFDLFERKHRKLILNDKGKLAIKRAEKIFMLGDELMQSLKGASQKVRSHLRIGVGQTLTNTFLHDFTQKAWKDPDTMIQVIHGDYKFLVEQLNQGNIDIILSDSPVQASSKRFKNTNMGSQKLMVVGTEKFKSVRKNFPYSLNNQPFMSFGLRGQVHSEIDYFFRINNIRPDIIGGADDLSLNQTVSEKGTCLTILPEKMALKAIKEKKLIKIGDFPEIDLSHWVVTSPLSSRSLAVRKIINQNLVRKRKVSK